MPANKALCPCLEVTPVGPVTGICVGYGLCKATAAPGGLDPSQALLGGLIGQALGALLKAAQGGGEKGNQDQGGGGGGYGQQCTTLQPTQDQSLVSAYPGCYYYQAPINPIDPIGSTTPSIIDPSGGLVAIPMAGRAPLAVTFGYNNGPAGCGTPPLVMDFGDGFTENLPTHSGNTCTAIEESISHTFERDGSYIVRMKNAETQAVKGGVTITVGIVNTATSTSPVPDSIVVPGAGENTNVELTKTGVPTVGRNTNISNTLFTTPFSNLNNTGSLTGGTNTGGSVSTGGSTGAALNVNTPQSIVQSIIQKNVAPGAYGDVKVLENGTTIVAGVRNGNSEVAGFFGLSGKNTSGGISTVQRLCTARPWATNFLGKLIPPSFFDSLCTWRGYTVGAPAATAPVAKTTTKTVTPVAPKTNTKSTSTRPVATSTPSAAVQTKVDIWASPATVPLGARTSVFWNSQAVKSCVITAPDGGFSHNTPQGGASTVPLTTSTTFTISCIGLDDKPYTDNVTVLIAL
jgi:hypothetical protein